MGTRFTLHVSRFTFQLWLECSKTRESRKRRTWYNRRVQEPGGCSVCPALSAGPRSPLPAAGHRRETTNARWLVVWPRRRSRPTGGEDESMSASIASHRRSPPAKVRADALAQQYAERRHRQATALAQL